MRIFLPTLINRNFKLLWLSQLTSQLTIQILNFLLIINLFEETESTIATSVLWIAYALPSLIFGPFAAAISDKSEKRKLLLFTNGLQTIMVVFSSLVITQNFYTSYVFVFLYSILNQLYVPSEFSALPSLIPKSDYPKANSLFLITQQVATVIGFTIAGSLQGFLGFGTTLLLCSGFLAIATISVYFLPKINPNGKSITNFRSTINDYVGAISDGYRYIVSQNQILYPFVALICMSLSVSIITVNMPAIAQEVVKVPADASGLTIALPVGIGALVGAYFTNKTLSSGVRKLTLIKSTIAIFLGGLILTTFSSYVFSNIVALYVSIFGVIILGFSFFGMVIPLLTYLQETVKPDLRGRVFGNFWFVVTAISIVPVIFSGFISQYFGPQVLFFLLIIFASFGFVFVRTKGDQFIKSNFRK